MFGSRVLRTGRKSIGWLAHWPKQGRQTPCIRQQRRGTISFSISFRFLSLSCGVLSTQYYYCAFRCGHRFRLMPHLSCTQLLNNHHSDFNQHSPYGRSIQSSERKSSAAGDNPEVRNRRISPLVHLGPIPNPLHLPPEADILLVLSVLRAPVSSKALPAVQFGLTEPP